MAIFIHLIVMVGIALTVNYLCFHSNPYTFVKPWNSIIAYIRDAQNLMYDNDLPPSMQHAESCIVSGVQEFNRLLRENHDVIQSELATLISNGYHGSAVADTDSVQYREFNGQRGWRVYWMQLLGTESGTATALPTLKRIVDKSADTKLFQVFVSVFFPPTADGEVEATGWSHVFLPLHHGILRSVYRYHYALEIPQGDTGMILSDVQFQWKERHGYIFDDTLLHATWNLTGKRRVLIIADFPRDLGWFLNGVNQFVLLPLIKHTKVVREMVTRIATLKGVDSSDENKTFS